MTGIISVKKRNRFLAGIIFVIMLLMLILAVKEEGALFPQILICAGLLLVSTFTALLRKPSGPAAVIINLITLLASPFLAVWIVQYFTLDPLRIYPLMLLCNCVFYYLFYLALSFILGSFLLGYFVADVLFLLVGVSNFFVVQFRGSPIVPWDLLSLGTAASVAGNYSYNVTWVFAVCVGSFAVLIALAAKNTWKIRPVPVRIIGTVVLCAALAYAGLSLQKKETKNMLGMDQTLFTPNVRYRNNGFLAAFIGNLHLINVQAPEGYSADLTRQLQERTQKKHPEAAAAAASFDISKAPNIIVIVDEAFSDLKVLGDFDTDIDYMPNFRKLMQDYNGGHLMVSVKGGNTANSEYEFLSGDTMAFLPAGSVVFQQFIHDNVPALPSYLASLGFSTTGIHPYLETGWDRDRVYPMLGFEEFITKKDFADPFYIRDYISDVSAFDKIIEKFENREEGEKQFIFEVTMQNHSGYSKEHPGFEEEVNILGLTSQNTQTHAAQKYLTLIYESDKALGMLMDYFEEVKEPTIIVMFGDHEPTDYITNVITRLVGSKDTEDLEETQKAFLVPYFVWNNFGMEMEDHELTSLNYLAADLLKAAGIPLSTYHEFLLDLQETLPVICAGAYVDSSGSYHSFDADGGEYEDLLREYNILQYNHLNDREHRVTELFSVPCGS